MPKGIDKQRGISKEYGGSKTGLRAGLKPRSPGEDKLPRGFAEQTRQQHCDRHGDGLSGVGFAPTDGAAEYHAHRHRDADCRQQQDPWSAFEQGRRGQSEGQRPVQPNAESYSGVNQDIAVAERFHFRRNSAARRPGADVRDESQMPKNGAAKPSASIFPVAVPL